MLRSSCCRFSARWQNTLAAIWENWKRPGTEEWVRTFAVITCPANELMSEIHDRMPVIIPPESYDRWLSAVGPDPNDLLVQYPSERMKLADLDAGEQGNERRRGLAGAIGAISIVL